jgi:hypothetical protein
MAGATEQEIAAYLGHSTTALVRRYAHLNPSHLKGVVEWVSQFRKQQKGIGQSPVDQVGLQPGEKSLLEGRLSDGTEIKPGMMQKGKEGSVSEVLEINGGPCRGRTYGPLIKRPNEAIFARA